MYYIKNINLLIHKMKKRFYLISLGLCLSTTFAFSQFGGFNAPAPNVEASEKFLDVNYANDGQVYHNMDIYLPLEVKDSYKAVIVIYGSAWFTNNSKSMTVTSLGKPLLDAGFAIISINHRSSSDAAYPAQINDVKAAIRYIRANAAKYKIDPSFIGITGFSSGGHLASMAGVTNGIKEHTIGSVTMDIEGNIGEFTSTSSKVNAVADWFGPVDMERMSNCEKPNDASSPEAALIKSNPADSPDLVKMISPINFVDKNDPRFIVFHGDADNVVPHCQSMFFSETLEKAGILEKMITAPGGGHGAGTFNDANYKEMTDFFLKEASRK